MNTEARNVGLLLALGAAGLVASFQVPGDIFFDFGPNDARYVRGFREDFEVDEPTILHWSSDRAEIRLPFYLRGPYDVTLRYKRHVAAPADVHVFLGGSLVDRFRAPRKDFRLRSFRFDNESAGAFDLRILTRSADPRPLGLALDWMQIHPIRTFGAIIPTPEALFAMLAWVIGFYVAARLLGFGTTSSFRLGLAAIVALFGMSAIHKFWPVHAALTLGVRTHVVLLGLIVFYRWRRLFPSSAFSTPEARFALVFVYVGLAVRLFALFHPDFYYPDVRTHSKFVSLIWTEGLGGFFQTYLENQHTHLLGLQLVGGRWLAFPYPPLLYLTIYPLSRLQLPVEDWMKLVPAALVAVEALMIFALARKLGLRSRAAAFAVLLHASARVVAFRLAVASYAALFGHFWDVLTVLTLVFFFDRIERPRYALCFAGLVAISLLSYAGSALVLGLFIPAFCVGCLLSGAGERGDTRRLIAIASWAFVGALAALSLFYWRYLPELLSRPEHGAATVSAGALVELRLTPLAALRMAAHRMNLFYGSFFTALTAIALVISKKASGHVLAPALVFSTVATFLGLNVLRAGLGATHIFQFSKDDLVLLPLVVLVLGWALDRWSSVRYGRFLTAGILLGWVFWGGLGLAGDIRGRFIRPDYPPPVSGSGHGGGHAQEAKTTRLPPSRFA